ncbi:MAG: hypothetical protein LBD40_01770 [Puniceicoccales bacterium]|jgi:hypothetical protein|nr:hypothetical protein [Puniceicoccales bacterium]
MNRIKYVINGICVVLFLGSSSVQASISLRAQKVGEAYDIAYVLNGVEAAIGEVSAYLLDGDTTDGKGALYEYQSFWGNISGLFATLRDTTFDNYYSAYTLVADSDPSVKECGKYVDSFFASINNRDGAVATFARGLKACIWNLAVSTTGKITTLGNKICKAYGAQLSTLVNLHTYAITSEQRARLYALVGSYFGVKGTSFSMTFTSGLPEYVELLYSIVLDLRVIYDTGEGGRLSQEYGGDSLFPVPLHELSRLSFRHHFVRLLTSLYEERDRRGAEASLAEQNPFEDKAADAE